MKINLMSNDFSYVSMIRVAVLEIDRNLYFNFITGDESPKLFCNMRDVELCIEREIQSSDVFIIDMSCFNDNCNDFINRISKKDYIQKIILLYSKGKEELSKTASELGLLSIYKFVNFKLLISMIENMVSKDDWIKSSRYLPENKIPNIVSVFSLEGVHYDRNISISLGKEIGSLLEEKPLIIRIKIPVRGHFFNKEIEEMYMEETISTIDLLNNISYGNCNRLIEFVESEEDYYLLDFNNLSRLPHEMDQAHWMKIFDFMREKFNLKLIIMDVSDILSFGFMDLMNKSVATMQICSELTDEFKKKRKKEFFLAVDDIDFNDNICDSYQSKYDDQNLNVQKVARKISSLIQMEI